MNSSGFDKSESEPRAFFGRRSGKRLHKGQQSLMDELLPALAYEPGAGARTPFANPEAPTVLEIGYGGGEHLARMAKSNPDTNFIGAEVFTGGIGKMLENGLASQGVLEVRDWCNL